MQRGEPGSGKLWHGQEAPSIHHQGRVFPSQSRKAPEVSCERLASTVRMPCTLCSTIRGACRRGQGTASLLWAYLAWKSAGLGQTVGCMAWGAALMALMGVFFLTATPLFSVLGGWGGQGWLSRALGMLQLAACSLPALPQRMVLAAHSITQHPLPQVPLPSPRVGGTNSGGPADPPLHSPVPSLSPCQSSPSQDGWPRTRSPCLGALQPCTSSPCSGQPGRGTTMPAQFGAWVCRRGGHLSARKWLWRWEMGLGPGVKHRHNPPERLSPRCYWSRSPCLRLGEPGRGWVAWGRWVPPWAPLSTGMVHSRASPAPHLAPHLAGTVRVHGGLWHLQTQPDGAQFGGDVDDRGPAAAQPLLPHALRCLLQEWQKFLKQRHQRSVNT